MKRARFTGVFVLIMLVLPACSGVTEETAEGSIRKSTDKLEEKRISNESAIKSALEEIILIDYLPIAYTRNQYILPNSDGTNDISIEITKNWLGKNNVTERAKEIGHFRDNVLLGSDIAYYTVSQDEIKDDDGNVYLKRNLSWESNEKIRSIEKLGETVEVKAGIFEDCIIVKEFDPKVEDFYTVFTYAPRVGVIKLTSHSTKNGDSVLGELLHTETSGDRGVDYALLEQMRNGAKPLVSSESIQDELVNEDVYKEDLAHSDETEEELIIDKVSKDQSITETNLLGKVSTLYLADYTERVNDMAFEQLDTVLLHNPAYEETLKGGIYSFPVMTYASPSSDELVIAVSESGNIRDMSWKSEEMLSEEIALHILVYLKALVDPAESENSEINERVEQFVFSSSNPSKAVFGEFTAELSSSSEGFVFRFYVK